MLQQLLFTYYIVKNEDVSFMQLSKMIWVEISDESC